jgi:hypothetical protein
MATVAAAFRQRHAAPAITSRAARVQRNDATPEWWIGGVIYRKAMTDHLRRLGIDGDASYAAWCTENHPGAARARDGAALDKFLLVTGEYIAARRAAPPPETELFRSRRVFAEYAMCIRRRDENAKCAALVADTPGGVCYRDALPDEATCFHHQPDTDHMRFVDGSPAVFFGPGAMRPKTLFQPNRTARTCTARKKDGLFCTKSKRGGGSTCHIHAEV